MIHHTNGMSKAICQTCKFGNWYDTAHVQRIYLKREWGFIPTKVECGGCEKVTVKINDQEKCEWHRIGEAIEREALA